MANAHSAGGNRSTIVWVIVGAAAVVLVSVGVWLAYGYFVKKDRHDPGPPGATGSHPLRDSPTTVEQIGSYTPLASGPVYFVVLGADRAVDGTTTHVTATFKVSRDAAATYHEGQTLSPAETNALIDGQ